MNLSDLKKLCEAATPGPWSPRPSTVQIGFQTKGSAHSPLIESGNVVRQVYVDAEFIAAARTHLPLLIEVAEAAKSYFETEECRDCYTLGIKNALDKLEAAE